MSDQGQQEIPELEPMDPTKENSPVVPGPDSEPSDSDQKLQNPCVWNGATYSHCGTVQSGGYRYHCYDGRWIQYL